MSVIGGRQGWSRGGWLTALVGIASAAACGGRTSALDSSVYDASVDETGGSGGAGASNAGRGGGAGRGATASAGRSASSGGARPVGGNGGAGAVTGGAGKAGAGGTAGNAGTGGAIGVDISKIGEVCRKHCGTYGEACGESETLCPIECGDELLLVTDSCRAAGYAALICVDAFFPKGSGCGREEAALDACSDEIDAFHRCKGSRVVTPIPRGSPNPYVTGCSPLFNKNEVSCNAAFSCVTGDYLVYCAFSADAAFADCSCSTPAGTVASGLVTKAVDPCLDAARALCH